MEPEKPRVLEEHPEVAEHVLERIRVDGPLSSLDFERRHGAHTRRFGAQANVVRAVLEAYAYTGLLGLARREGSRRYYDLLERLVPAGDSPTRRATRRAAPAQDASSATARTACSARAPAARLRQSRPREADGRVARSSRSYGFARQLIESGDPSASTSRAFAGTIRARGRSALLEDPPEPAPSVAFLSPFDPFVWDRALLASLFEIRLRLDLFHPPAKRRFGWYVLPILFRTASPAGSSRASTGTAGASRCLVSGGRRASPHGASTAWSRQCATRSPPTFVSRG